MANAIDRFFFEREEQRLLLDIERAAANLRYATERHREFREHRDAERLKLSKLNAEVSNVPD